MSDNIITEKTLIPMSLIIGLASALIGSAAWLTTIWYQSRANAATIVEIKRDQKEIRLEIREDIHRLEKKIDKLLERQR